MHAIWERPAPLDTRPALATLLGALAGAFGGALGLSIAQVFSMMLGTADPVAILDVIAGPWPFAGFLLAGVVGASFGALLAYVMRWSARFLTRAIFACTVSPAAWFCLHVFLPWRGWIDLFPLLPMLGAAFVLGACVACVPPLTRVNEKDERPPFVPSYPRWTDPDLS